MADNVVQANPRLRLPVSLLRDNYIYSLSDGDVEGMTDPLNPKIPSLDINVQPPATKPNISNIRDLPSKSKISPAINPLTNLPDLQGSQPKSIPLLGKQQLAIMDAVTNIPQAKPDYTKVADLQPSKPMQWKDQQPVSPDAIRPIMQGPVSKAAEFLGSEARAAGRQAAENFGFGTRTATSPTPSAVPLLKTPDVQGVEQPVPTTGHPPNIAPKQSTVAPPQATMPQATMPLLPKQVVQPPPSVQPNPAAQSVSASPVVKPQTATPVPNPASPIPSAPVQRQAQMAQPGSIDNLDRVAAASPLIRGMTNSGVLRASENEVNLLDRMRREGARGSASTRDIAAQAPRLLAQQQAEQYDTIGRRQAQDQAAIQRQLVQSQGQAATMPVEAQARGNVAMQQEKTKEGLGVADITGKAHVAGMVGAAEQNAKAAQASLLAAHEYRKEEKESDRQARLQLALNNSYIQQGIRADAATEKKHLSQSNTFEKAFAQEAMDPAKQFGQLSGVVQSMKDANHPDWKTHRDTVFQHFALPMAVQIAPKATPEQQDAIAKELNSNGGNVNKLPKELLALVTVK